MTISPAKALAELYRDLAGKGYRFRIIAVHMENRCLHAFRYVRGIRRAARKLRAGGETNLVVDHEMDTAASIIAADSGEAEAFPRQSPAPQRPHRRGSIQAAPAHAW